MNEEVKLHTFNIVIFYRSQLDSYCREYLLSFQKLVEKINHYRGFIFGVSTDINNSLFEMMGNDQKITLISDVDLNIINQFGTEVFFVKLVNEILVF
jgi:peroxiredoxin